jgi:predicted dehydrogenase
MRVALLGIGDAGRHHARALRTLHAAGALRWAAACGRDAAQAASFCAAEGAPAETTAHGDLAAMLRDTPLDAVIIATPDGLHAEHAAAALSRGLHVLVEKPLALELADVRALLAAAQGASRTLAVGYQLRHHAAHRLAREELRARVGELLRVEARWAWPDPATQGWRARAVCARYWALAALGTHLVDLALWFAGETRVERVAADVRRRDGVDVAVDATLRLANGVVALLGADVTYRATPRLALVGTAGELELLGTLGARGAGTLAHRTPRGETTAIAFTPVDPYLAQLEAFVRDARAGAPADTAGEAALADVELLARIASAG